MANEDKKDFNAMLRDSKDMPKFQIITDQKSIEKYGGSKMYFAPPIDYDKVMKKVPYGKVTTIGQEKSGNILPDKAAGILQSLSQQGFLYPLLHGPVISVPKTKLPTGGL